MNIRNLNLNLLIALDALLTERNVTLAAKKIFITQSAMSNSLKQCRELFKDELLIRTHRGMKATSKGLALQPKIRELLDQIETIVLENPCFDAKTSTRKFKIGMTDLVEFNLLPLLLQALKTEAPNISLEIIHLNQLTDTDLFTQHQLELAVGCFLKQKIPNIRSEKMYSLSSVVLTHKNNPLSKKALTLDDYLNAKHIRVKYQNPDENTRVDESLKKIGKTRNVVATLPHILPLLFMLDKSDYLVSMPDILSAKVAKQLGIIKHQLPFPVYEVDLHLIWHQSADRDEGVAWLKEFIMAKAREMKI